MTSKHAFYINKTLIFALLGSQFLELIQVTWTAFSSNSPVDASANRQDWSASTEVEFKEVDEHVAQSK